MDNTERQVVGFLPEKEQQLYDSIVHGLRSQGWSRAMAEAEAIDRIDRSRHKEQA
jgi:hypothetical protein